MRTALFALGFLFACTAVLPAQSKGPLVDLGVCEQVDETPEAAVYECENGYIVLRPLGSDPGVVEISDCVKVSELRTTPRHYHVLRCEPKMIILQPMQPGEEAI